MDTGQLTEKDILSSIRRLSEEFEISFGQAQKAINVVLKYHFYLTRSEDAQTKKVLHCPIDSVVLKDLIGRKFSLALIDEKMYLAIQDVIQKRSKTRIDYDRVWDKQHLQDEGIM